MKEQFNDIQLSIMDAASKEVARIGQNFISGFEGLGLNDTQKKAVAVQIELAVDGVELLVGSKAKQVFGLIKDEIDKNLDKIDIIPKELRTQIGNMCKSSVDKFDKLVSEAIGQVSKSAKEVSEAVIDQGVKALKSTFDNIGAWLKGEKTAEQAMTEIKAAWKEAGQEASKSFNEAKKSFVEKVGGKNVDQKEKAHAVRVAEKSDSPTSKSR